MLHTTMNTRLLRSGRKQPALCCSPLHITSAPARTSSRRGQLVATNAVSRWKRVSYRVGGGFWPGVALVRRDSPAVANSQERTAQTWITCWMTLQRADELPRSAAVREPQAIATPTAAPGTEEGDAAKPRLVILGSGWASMSLIQALPNDIK